MISAATESGGITTATTATEYIVVAQSTLLAAGATGNASLSCEKLELWFFLGASASTTTCHAPENWRSATVVLSSR